MSAVDVMYQPYSNNLHCYPRPAIDQPKLHDIMERTCYPNTDVLMTSPTTTTSPTVTTPPPHQLHPHLPPHQQQITTIPHAPHHTQHPQATSLSLPSTTSHQHHTQTHQPVPDMVTSPVAATSLSRSNSAGTLCRGIVKEEDESCEDAVIRPVATHFLSNSSYLRIFVNVDFNQCIEEHFRKSLAQQHTNYKSTGSPHSAGASPDGSKTTRYSKDSLPMTQRNFPPSFWDPHICNTLSNSYLDSNPLPFNTSNPYLSSATLHGISSLHQVAAASPWHYPISSHSQGSYHRPSPATHMHYDFSYSSMAAAAAAAASSRFANTHGQYNPLIMPHHPVATASQPATATAMRSASGPFNSMPGQHCDISGKSAADLPTTARRFVEYPSHTNLEPVLTGMEGPMQDNGKDMYWY